MEDLEGNDTRCNWFLHSTFWCCLLRGKVILRKALLLREADISPRSFVKIVSAFPR